MRKIKILTDTTVDLNNDLIKRYDIDMIPLAVHLGETEFKDGVDITPNDIYSYVEKTKKLPKTAAASVFEYESFFKKWVDQDYEIIYTGIGSKMSASYMSAKLAAETVAPERIHVVDSLNLSAGTGLIACKAGDMMLSGCNANEIVEYMTSIVPKVRVTFIVDTIDYLYMGGRCTTLESFAAGILNLRPRLIVKNGVTVSDKKYRGNFDSCLSKYIKDTIAEMTNIDKTRVLITNAITPNSDLSDKDFARAKAEVEKLSPDEICYTHAGNIVFSHCGPRAIGILYIDN